MRKLTQHEKDLWARICSTINQNSGRKRAKIFKEQIQNPVSSVIDLHGYTEDSSYGAISQLIVSNYLAGNNQLTIITGKGKGGIGVLRRLVPYWLDTSLSAYVRSYHFDPKNLGQLIVMIKKR